MYSEETIDGLHHDTPDDLRQTAGAGRQARREILATDSAKFSTRQR